MKLIYCLRQTFLDICIPTAYVNIERLLAFMCNREVPPGNICENFTMYFSSPLHIPRVTDDNLLGTQKTVSLDFDEE